MIKDVRDISQGEELEADVQKAASKESVKEMPAETAEDDSQKKRGEKSPLRATGVLGNKTIEDVINREAKEEQDTSSPFSLQKTLGGVIVARAVQKQIWLVLLVCAFLILHIYFRYACQEKMVQISRVEKKIVEARYKSIVCSSILTEKCRESNVMEQLKAYGDSTLTIPNEPPYLIRIEEE